MRIQRPPSYPSTPTLVGPRSFSLSSPASAMAPAWRAGAGGGFTGGGGGLLPGGGGFPPRRRPPLARGTSPRAAVGDTTSGLATVQWPVLVPGRSGLLGELLDGLLDRPLGGRLSHVSFQVLTCPSPSTTYFCV